MAQNESPNSHPLFPDMVSFSLEPELLTFLWGFRGQSGTEPRNYRHFLPTSSTLLQIFVPDENQRLGFLTFIKCTVVTAGTIVVVGVSSYGTFKVLQKLRYEGIEGVRQAVAQAIESLKTRKRILESNGLALVLRRRKSASPTGDNGIFKRPSDLTLINEQSNTNGSQRLNSSSGTFDQNPDQLFPMTPKIGEMASGDDDVAEVQGQYFGPLAGSEMATPNTSTDFVVGSPSSSLPYDFHQVDRLSTPRTPCLPPPADSKSNPEATSNST